MDGYLNDDDADLSDDEKYQIMEETGIPRYVIDAWKKYDDKLKTCKDLSESIDLIYELNMATDNFNWRKHVMKYYER